MVASHVSQDGGIEHVALVHVVYHLPVFGVDLIDHVADYGTATQRLSSESRNKKVLPIANCK